MPGDDLFTPYERGRGPPLGNQTSQFFANVYLNELDRFVMREIGAPAYCRYVDDFLIFGDDPAVLVKTRRRVQERLDSLRLRLHDGKNRLYKTASRISFLGWRISVFADFYRLISLMKSSNK